MKIFGLGNDIVTINRITKAIKKSNFKSRVFSKNEILHCERKKNKFACYAKRFSAKEAFVKSLGTGLSMGLSFNEIEVKNNKKGLPYIKLHGDSLKIVKRILKKKFNIFLSLSDDHPYAAATVILVTK